MGPSFYPNVDYWGFDSKPLNAAAAKRTIDDVAHSPQVALPNGFFQAVEVQTLRSIDNTVTDCGTVSLAFYAESCTEAFRSEFQILYYRVLQVEFFRRIAQKNDQDL